jgi:hypothetical protein
MIEFVVASHDHDVFKKNILSSSAYSQFVFTVKRGFNNISQAYNSAQPREGNIVIYMHHDVFLPDTFADDLEKALERVPGDWGVLGVAGVKLIDGQKKIHGHISDRGKEWGSPWLLPAEVDTLDELLLITRGDLKFDEQFDLHFYGADLCMQAKLQGLKCYAISAYCEHNSGLGFGERTDVFRECERKFREKYIDHLPIATTCSIVS